MKNKKFRTRERKFEGIAENWQKKFINNRIFGKNKKRNQKKEKIRKLCHLRKK